MKCFAIDTSKKAGSSTVCVHCTATEYYTGKNHHCCTFSSMSRSILLVLLKHSPVLYDNSFSSIITLCSEHCLFINYGFMLCGTVVAIGQVARVGGTLVISPICPSLCQKFFFFFYELRLKFYTIFCFFPLFII